MQRSVDFYRGAHTFCREMAHFLQEREHTFYRRGSTLSADLCIIKKSVDFLYFTESVHLSAEIYRDFFMQRSVDFYREVHTSADLCIIKKSAKPSARLRRQTKS